MELCWFHCWIDAHVIDTCFFVILAFCKFVNSNKNHKTRLISPQSTWFFFFLWFCDSICWMLQFNFPGRNLLLWCKINCNPSFSVFFILFFWRFFFLSKTEPCSHDGDDPGPEGTFSWKNVPSRPLTVVLLHKVFPCPVCDPLDTRCLLSFKTLLPPSLFVPCWGEIRYS